LYNSQKHHVREAREALHLLIHDRILAPQTHRSTIPAPDTTNANKITHNNNEPQSFPPQPHHERATSFCHHQRQPLVQARGSYSRSMTTNQIDTNNATEHKNSIATFSSLLISSLRSYQHGAAAEAWQPHIAPPQNPQCQQFHGKDTSDMQPLPPPNSHQQTNPMSEDAHHAI